MLGESREPVRSSGQEEGTGQTWGAGRPSEPGSEKDGTCSLGQGMGSRAGRGRPPALEHQDQRQGHRKLLQQVAPTERSQAHTKSSQQ